MRSSAFEGMLLKATWPGNEPVPQDILTEIIKHSIPAFKYSQSVSLFDEYAAIRIDICLLERYL